MAVVADVNADLRESRFKSRVAEIARTKIKLFPKTGIDVRNVSFAVFAQIFAVSINHGG
ncbi:MAG TPA: hypothetical protein VEQ34_08955 [Pyrinomonadaceae bacterium]|nr:hypothetical protein [Pyrinomonadaceae bacterium]